MREKLIAAVIKNKDKLSYINLNSNNEYQGWTYDFNIFLPSDMKMCLDLKREDDLFLLFVLASSWSKTGPWENAAFFTTYLKESGKAVIDLWLDDSFVKSEIDNSDKNARNIVKLCSGLVARKKVSFRSDFYSSVSVIAKNWSSIKETLETANLRNDYMIFINYISTLDGLGAGQKRMRIKIPLILRELRCQSIYSNIPGELCCVPDERVKESSKMIGLKIPHVNSIDSLFKASAVIYKHFGDLYDIPLFAYEDLKQDIV
ncbi:MAG: hypothetical protein N2645_20310 [Clostridia bacterium]|nr:hypothetical protein [Clostridia bacterium]